MVLFKDTTAFIVAITLQLLVFLIPPGGTSPMNILIRSQNVSCVKDKINVQIPELNGVFHITLTVVMKNARNRQIQLTLIKYRNERPVKSWNTSRIESSNNLTTFGLDENIKINHNDYQAILCQGNGNQLKKLYILSGRITFTEKQSRNFKLEKTEDAIANLNILSKRIELIIIYATWLYYICISLIVIVLIMLCKIGYSKWRRYKPNATL